MKLIDADKFKRHFPHDEDWDYPVNTNSLIVELLDEEPTVEERKKGEWESFVRCFQTTYHSADTQRLFECSVCRYNTNITTRFCPNCGADMRGE